MKAEVMNILRNGSFIRVNYAEVVDRETMEVEAEIESACPCWWWRPGLIRFAD